MRNILEVEKEDLLAWFLTQGEQKFRVEQVWQWLWGKGVENFYEMTNISKLLRERLNETFSISWPKLNKVSVSRDGTHKFLIKLEDNELIETVLIPEKDHYTLCISSQVGCLLGCTFCHTGQMGFKRNLKAYEIVAQVILAKKFIQEHGLARLLRNIVYMGMGEPLLNWQEVKKSLVILNHEKYLNFSKRRITLSTIGVLDTLRLFGDSKLGRLAVSLHASFSTLRTKIMPATSKWPLEELLLALEQYPLEPRERITIEYILLNGVNDSKEDALELVRILKGIRCKINLIKYNPWPGSAYKPPSEERILAFEKVLWDHNLTAILRKSKGEDILAACGQLRASVN